MYDSIGQGHLTLVAKIRMNVQTNVSNALSDRCMCETHQYTSGLFLGCHETFQVFFTYKPAKLSTGLNQEHNRM